MRVHRGAVLLGAAVGASGAAVVALAGAYGMGPGAAFPLLALWIVGFVVAVKLGRRVAARLRGRA